MIKERYVSAKLASILKDKGFKEPCRQYYDYNDDFYFERFPFDYNSMSTTCTSAPTLYMVEEWLRTKDIYIYIQPTKYVGGALYGFQAVVEDGRNSAWEKSIHHAEGHEEAVEEAIKYCLENLI